ncbi:MAG TPA: NfeD family protein [Planctomycetota bacterium]|nr:NfeD family protein [Planctomycetota bacterium]
MRTTSWALVLGWWACCTAGTALPAQQTQEHETTAIYVNLTGKLGTPELALCQRALRLAASEGYSHVVFRLDSAGGITEADRDVAALLDQVQASKVPTVALVRGAVFSGAAYLAIVCDQLVCMHGAQVGKIAPVTDDLDRLLQLGDDDAERKHLQALREELRGRLDRRKVKLTADAIKLCEGMIDPSLQLLRATVQTGGVESQHVYDQKELRALGTKTTVVQQTPVTRPVVLDAHELEDSRISRGTVQTLEQMTVDVLQLDRNALIELRPNWSEHMAGWLAMLQPVLLVMGFVLLVLEVKTPGVGLPGVLGTGLLALALFYGWLVGLADVTEILLFFLGLAAIGVEIFLLPGTIIFGAVGFLCLLVSLVLSQQSFVIPHSVTEQDILLANLWNLTLLFVLVLASASLLWKFLPRVPVLKSIFLPPPSPAANTGASLPAPDPRAALLGRTGRATTTLRPAGVLELDGERIDVVTSGEFVAAGTAVRVIAVQGMRVVVEAVAADPRASERGSAGLVLLIAVVGLLLLVAEVVLVSFGALLVLAGVALITAVFLAFQDSFGFGISVLVGEGLAAPVVLFFAFKALPHTRIGKAIMLAAPAPQQGSAAAADPELQALLDRVGVTTSALRPAGFARIDGRRVDVVTRGEMIPAERTVKVIEVTGNRVVVAAADPTP